MMYEKPKTKKLEEKSALEVNKDQKVSPVANDGFEKKSAGTDENQSVNETGQQNAPYRFGWEREGTLNVL